MIGIAALVAATIACEGSFDATKPDQRASAPEVTMEQMVDPTYLNGQIVRYEGEFCYGGGWPGTGYNGYLSIRFTDEQSGNSFFASATSMGTEALTKVNGLLASVNCEESILLYGKKQLDGSGNPELRISAIEYKVGPNRPDGILVFQSLSADSTPEPTATQVPANTGH